MGLAVFIVPFMFFYSPLLLGQGTAAEIAPVLATAAIGVVLLACSTEGWFGRQIGLALRVPLAAGALLLIVPGTIADIVGIAIAACVYAGARLMPEFSKS
jgi:TRAP-type uncharacterized transport system fused permease subunit